MTDYLGAFSRHIFPAQPACDGLWELFDSTSPKDHAEARRLCAACPIARQCADLLAAEKSSIRAAPTGTWNGQLFGREKREVVPEAGFTPEQMRQAHAAYNRGDRSEWATAGHRVYERVGKRRRRNEAASRDAA